jgi:hypothetical protein
MEDGGGHMGGIECSTEERHGEERERDTEEDRRERRLSGRCGHHGCGDEKKLHNEARRKRNAFVICF